MRKKIALLVTTLLAIPMISEDVKSEQSTDENTVISENSSMEDILETRCGNCGAYLDQEDKYCKICGTKAGEGEYKASEDLMQCIYGPMPVERVHRCETCGYTWSTNLMIDDENFCPKCGGRAPGMEETEEEETEQEEKQLSLQPFHIFFSLVNVIKKFFTGLLGM